MEPIDVALTREQFADFDPEVVTALCDATQSDLRQWSGRLLAAWDSGDQDGIGRARHALKGVCGNYGAESLIELAAEPLDEASARERFATCVETTIAAIRAVAMAHGAA